MTNIAYTVGNEVSYDKAIAESKFNKKLGEHTLNGVVYDGGAVWQTPEQAQAFIVASDYPYAVYAIQLQTNWDTDTKQPVNGEDFYRLKTDATLVKKVYFAKPVPAEVPVEPDPQS